MLQEAGMLQKAGAGAKGVMSRTGLAETGLCKYTTTY